MKKIQLFLLQFLLISITQHTNAQLPVKTEYTVEMGGTSGKGTYAPMWLTANRQGLSSANTENGYLRAGIAHTMPLNQHFGFSAGLDLATAYNFTSSFIIQQAYADLSYRWLNLSIGSKERLPELKNSKLSSGGMVESNNARPIPQIRLEVPDYVAIPGTHKWLHLKGHIAYGRFTDDKWQEHFTSIGNPYTIDVLYHSKSLFAKVGNKEHFPVEFEGGIQMSAQFGGDQYIAGQKEPYRGGLCRTGVLVCSPAQGAHRANSPARTDDPGRPGRFEYSRAGRALHSARHRGEKGAGNPGLPAAERCIPACGRCGLCSGDYFPDRGVLAKPCIC